MLRTNTKYCSVEKSSPAGNGSHSLGSETAQIIAEEDLELKQTISRSRNPSSDLVIAPEPVLAEVTKASTNNNNNNQQNHSSLKSQGMSHFVKTFMIYRISNLKRTFGHQYSARYQTLYYIVLTNFVHLKSDLAESTNLESSAKCDSQPPTGERQLAATF